MLRTTFKGHEIHHSVLILVIFHNKGVIILLSISPLAFVSLMEKKISKSYLLDRLELLDDDARTTS